MWSNSRHLWKEPFRFSGSCCNIFIVRQSDSVWRLISVIPALEKWRMRTPRSLRCEQLNKPRGSLGFSVRQPEGSSQWVGSAGMNTCCSDPTSWVLALEPTNKLDVVSYNSNISTVGSQEVETGKSPGVHPEGQGTATDTRDALC